MLPSAAPLASILPLRLKLNASMLALDCPERALVLPEWRSRRVTVAVGVTECGLVRCRRKRGCSADGKRPNAPQGACLEEHRSAPAGDDEQRATVARIAGETTPGDPSGLLRGLPVRAFQTATTAGGGCIVPLTGWPVAKVRPSGENMEVFNKPSLAEHALSLKSFFITAIGHKEDISLLQKVADKAFITPTALGQYFNEIYNHTVEELQGSKAKLVEDITAQLKGSYEMQVNSLNEKLQSTKELNEQQAEDGNGTNRRA